MLSLDTRLSSITGRGGARFPLEAKMEAVKNSGRPAQLIVNGVESDPYSAKDKFVMRNRAADVMEGVCKAAELIDAQETHIVAPAEYLPDLAVAASFTMPPALTFHEAAPGLVAGEASAVEALVRGLPPKPRRPFTHLADEGILLSNVETMYQLGKLGPVTTLLTINHLVYELEQPVYLRELALSGPVLVGGCHGYWVAAEDNPLIDGGSVTTGDVYDTTAQILTRLAAESARQCGPCLFGLPALSQAWNVKDFQRVSSIALHLPGRGGCKHPDGAARLALSALEVMGR